MPRTPAAVTPALALILVLSACGSGSTESGGGATSSAAAPVSQSSSSSSAAAPTPSASASPSHVSDTPQTVAATLKAAVPQVGKIVKLTEDNDVNKLLGRPGQYDAATFLQDKRLKCSARDNFDDLGVDCGAKVERWSTQEDAQARADDIQKKLKDYGLGAEYDYVRGRLLLRVAGDLKPSQAKIYKAAFVG